MVKIGVIGAGGNGSGHARYYYQSDRADVVAVADPDAERVEKLALEVEAKPFADFREFLDIVDAVVISSPNHLHRDHAIACAEAGRHVYCEKPMGVNAAQADEIAAAVKKAGVRSFVGFSVRFGGIVQTLKKFAGEGRLGEIFSIWSRRLTYMNPADRAGWRTDHSLSGGLLLEINIHEIEWMMAVGGEVQSVFARKFAKDQDHPRANDHIWAILNFAGDRTALHEGSWSAATGDYRRGIIGTEAGVTTDRWSQTVYFARNGEKEQEVDLEPRFDKRANFLDAIEKDAESVADVEWGLKVMKVTEAIIESANTGQVIAV
ncbi:MAG: Gfo/Idh/MocA family protein [Planctomycetota bacterium]